MNFLFNLSGANTPLIKEFDIEKNEKINAGEVVCLMNGVVKKAAAGAEILGVSAENHSGSPELLNARADGTKIRVYVSPTGVYSCKAPEYTAAETGTSTTLVTSAKGLGIGVKSGFAVLVSKADGSQNTDVTGTVRTVSNCDIAGDIATVTISEGGIPSVGDVYYIVPFIGDNLQLDEAASGVCHYNSASAGNVKLVYFDSKTGMVGVKLENTIFE